MPSHHLEGIEIWRIKQSVSIDELTENLASFYQGTFDSLVDSFNEHFDQRFLDIKAEYDETIDKMQDEIDCLREQMSELKDKLVKSKSKPMRKVIDASKPIRKVTNAWDE